MKEFLKKNLSEKWMKAAVVGSLWATVEIILGSLLHNLRVPFAGSTLSFITVYMLISFFQIWKINGLIWRAGLICALMKSISPSAIIMGPMIGILSQAMIMDMTIRLFGKNQFSYIAGGALAVFSALAQKALTLLILYGWEFVSLLENMYDFAARQIGWQKPQPVMALFALGFIYLSAGALAGMLGYKAGKKFIKRKEIPGYTPQVKASRQSDLFKHSKKGHSILLLIVSAIGLVAGMLIIRLTPLPYSVLFVLGFVLLVYLHFPDNMRYVRKPGIWIQFGIIIMLSAVFKNGLGQFFSTEGFIVGLQMSLRALLLLSGFAAISVELKNPIIKNLLYNKGFESLYQAADLAFSALPGIMTAFYNQTQHISGFKKLTHTMLNSSETLLDSFMEMDKNHMPVFVLTGKVNQGKTTLANEIVSKLKKEGIRLQGFVCPGKKNDQSKYTYYIKDIESGVEHLLCSLHPDREKQHYGRFYFEEDGIKAGCQIINKSMESQTDLLVIDELGPMEINNKGWAPAIENVLEHNASAQLWVVRDGLVKPMMRKWNLGHVIIFHLGEDTPDEIAKTISHQLKQHLINNPPIGIPPVIPS
jgi:nucleoside-triphosphatase THEP1